MQPLKTTFKNMLLVSFAGVLFGIASHRSPLDGQTAILIGIFSSLFLSNSFLQPQTEADNKFATKMLFVMISVIGLTLIPSWRAEALTVLSSITFAAMGLTTVRFLHRFVSASGASDTSCKDSKEDRS